MCYRCPTSWLSVFLVAPQSLFKSLFFSLSLNLSHGAEQKLKRTFLQMTVGSGSGAGRKQGHVRHQSDLCGKMIYWNSNLFLNFLNSLLPSHFKQVAWPFRASCSGIPVSRSGLQPICNLWRNITGCPCGEGGGAERRGSEQVGPGMEREERSGAGAGWGRKQVMHPAHSSRVVLSDRPTHIGLLDFWQREV